MKDLPIDIRGAGKKAKLLFRFGKYIEKNGLRRDFDAAITDCYLGKNLNTSYGPHECQQLRELLEYKDNNLPNTDISGRINIIEDLIMREAWN